MVGENDTLWHLGDWAFAPKSEYYKTCKYYRDKVKCKNVYFIWGNHDRREIANLFSGTYDLHHMRVDNQLIVLCHYAMLTFDKSHRGAICLYGHSHSNIENFADKIMPGRRSMDIGVDNAFKLLGNYRPFSFDEIVKIMSKRVGFYPDHHGKDIVSGLTEEELMG
jgi:calcineurin-like phosphoesterase family protein